jgi:predicted PurR-regulated permease PerM
METPVKPQTAYLRVAIEITIRLLVLIFIFGWCFEILRPFISPVISAIIIAVALYPLYDSLQRRLKGRRKLAASLITVLFVSLLIVPAWLLADSLIEGVQGLRTAYENGALHIPPPGEQTKDWPRITQPLIDMWQLASTNTSALVSRYSEEIKAGAKVLLGVLQTTGLGIVQLVLSIIIAGFLLYYSKHGGESVKKIFVKLGGDQGAHFAELSESTIRNVIKGVVGVAAIQSMLAAIGFVVAGVPLAGLWTLLCLILAIVQVGIGPVCLIVVIYMYSKSDPLTATLLTGWLVAVTLVDNFLKPILLGRGAKVPMLIVFLGALGGFFATGFVGLFLGAVILSIGYILFQSWLQES